MIRHFALALVCAGTALAPLAAHGAPLPAPSASLLTSTQGSYTDPKTQLALQWTPVGSTPVRGYRFGYSTTDARETDPSWSSPVLRAASAARPFVFTTLVSGATYKVYVEAVYTSGAVRRTTRTGTTQAPAPTPPPTPTPGALATPTITNLAQTTMTVNWQPPSQPGTSAVDGYQVGWGTWDSAMLPGTARSMDLATFTTGTTYTIRVRAHNAAGYGTWSQVTAPTPAAAPTSAAIIWREEFNSMPGINDGSVANRKFRIADWWRNQGQGWVANHANSWYVHPAQHGASNSPFSIVDGALRIRAWKNHGLSGVSQKWAGGMLISNYASTDSGVAGSTKSGEFTAPFYAEWRARWPNPGRGMFPALWLFAARGGAGPVGKDQAEIDVLEIFGYSGGTPYSTTVHNKTSPGTQHNLGETYKDTTNWHRYAVDVGLDYIRFYQDGTLVKELTGAAASWFNGVPLSIWTNYAMDVSWGTQSTSTDPAGPLNMDVDYIRVYSGGDRPTASGAADPENP